MQEEPSLQYEEPKLTVGGAAFTVVGAVEQHKTVMDLMGPKCEKKITLVRQNNFTDNEE